MIELGKILKQTRLKFNLSVEEVASSTSIRSHYIEMIEKGDLSGLTPVYARSFIKKYCEFLGISEEIYKEHLDELNLADPITSQTNLKANNSQKNKQINYAELFKKNTLKNIHSRNANLIKYFIYTSISILTLVIIYFIFSTTSNNKENDIPNKANNGGADTAVISQEDDNLLQYFEKQDSIILEVVSIDTSWVKINIDGKKSSEIVFTPSMKARWSAKNYFVITQGNVGALQFKRNGRILEPFGSRGSIVKNVKITGDAITY